MSYIPNGGVFPAQGESWREQRRISLSILRDLGMGKALMEEKIIVCLQQLLEAFDKLEDLESADISPLFSVILENMITDRDFTVLCGQCHQ